MLLFFHLSDIHLRTQRPNPVLGRIGAMPKAAFEIDLVRQATPTAIYVVVTGDIAFSGKEAEYRIARELRAKLDEAIERDLQVRATWVAVPGNHDCDFAGPRASIREALVANVSQPINLDEEYLSECLRPQSCFRDFASSLDLSVPENRLCWHQSIESPDGTAVHFRSVNTAWMSQLNEAPASIVLPINALDELATPEDARQHLIISLMHHPYSWHEGQSRRQLRLWLEQHSDIIFTGHEHDASLYRKTTVSSSVDYIEAGPLQTDSSDDGSTFNIVCVDPVSRRQLVATANWDADSSSYRVEHQTPSTPLLRERHLSSRKYVPSDSFTEWMTNPGAAYAHPRQRDLKLQDLFVFPPLEPLELTLREKSRSNLIKERQLDHLRESGMCILIGGERCGKSSIAKQTCHELRGLGIVPLALDIGRLRPTCRAQDIDEWIEECFRAAFGRSERLLTEWRSAEKRTKAAIIDDFHKLTSSSAKRERVCAALARHFGFVLLLADDALGLEELSTQGTCPTLWSFSRYRILEVGHESRGELIEKWCLLGSGEAPGDPAVSASVLRLEQQINTIMRSSLIPSYASYVLLMLSFLESTQESRVGTRAGSSAVLFEAMLTQQLAGVGHSVPDIKTIYTYLSRLAFRLFERKQDALSLSDFRQVHAEYASDYDVHLDASTMLAALCRALILSDREGRVCFKYAYARSYFTARYLWKHINDPAVREAVEGLTRALHRDEESSILLFLCHMAEDSDFVMQLVLDTARRQFPDSHEFDPTATNDFVAELVSDLPTLPIGPELVEDRSAEAHRAEARAARDRADEVSRSGEFDPSSEAQDELVAQFTAAHRTIQTLGQILRDAPGSIGARTKQELAQAAYSLGLRLLGKWFLLARTHRDALLVDLTRALKEIHPEEVTQDDFEPQVRRWLYRLCVAAVAAEMRHISNSLGTEMLLPTFERLAQRHLSSNPAYGTIDAAIRLDLHGAFPKAHLSEMAKRLKASPLGFAVLQAIVVHHLRVFPRSVGDRQFTQTTLDIRVIRNSDVLAADRKRFQT